MVMIHILRLLRGYVEFCAEGGFSERFINLCKINGIGLWDVKNDGVKVIAFTTEREFDELKIPAENSGMTIKVIKRRGLKNFIKSHKYRCGAGLGVFIAFLFWFFMAGFVWEVEILETQSVNVEAFTESLAELGVKVGARKSKIDILQVQKQLLNEYKELLWVSVNIFGGKVQVEMSEFVEQREIIDTKKPVNIVANKNGRVVLVKGYKGVNAVKEGDNVTKGSLLISGVCTNADGTEYFIHAKGEVYAKTKSTIKYDCKLQNSVQGLVNAQSRYYLYVFSVKIPLGLKAEGDFLSQSNKFLNSERATLPLAIFRDDTLQRQKQSCSLSRQEAALVALLDCVKEKRLSYNSSQLERVEYSAEQQADGVQVKVQIDCVENIAKENAILTEN